MEYCANKTNLANIAEHCIEVAVVTFCPPSAEPLLRVLVYRAILLNAGSGRLRDAAAHTCVGVGCRPRLFISDDARHD